MTQEKFNEMLENYLKGRAAIPPSEWSSEARAFCEKSGIIAGGTDGNMRYGSFVTREEAAQISERIVKAVTNISKN